MHKVYDTESNRNINNKKGEREREINGRKRERGTGTKQRGTL